MKKGFWIFLVLIGLVVLFACLRSIFFNNNLVVTTGRITSLEAFSQNPEVVVTFQYQMSDKTIVHKSAIPFSDKIKLRSLHKLLLNQELPVLYGKNDQWNCRMLFSEKILKNMA